MASRLANATLLRIPRQLLAGMKNVKKNFVEKLEMCERRVFVYLHIYCFI